MISLISDNKQAIANLCREFQIKKLDVFGSASTGAFDPDTSDLDFIVDLGEYDDDVGMRYLRFCLALEDHFGHSVEVITEPSIKNPYFREAVEEQRQNIYEAPDGQAAA